MSATTKKKHVTKEVLEAFPLPDGCRRMIVKVTAPRGNNLHEVKTAAGETFLVSMPTKFRKHVWIKRGDYILVEPIEEGGKVKAEISHILFREQIKHIRDAGLWPEAFNEKPADSQDMIPQDLLPPSDDEDNSDDLGDMVINLNRVNISEEAQSESDNDTDDDEEDEAAEKDEQGLSELKRDNNANDIADANSVIKTVVNEGCPLAT